MPTRRKKFVAKALVHSKALHVFFKRFLLERLARIKHEFAYPEKKMIMKKMTSSILNYAINPAN